MNDMTNDVAVWDPLVRIGHWLLLILFFVAYFTDDDFLTVHAWAGYGVASYVLLRLVWGLIGTRHARFSDFAYGPMSGLRYLKNLIRFRAERHVGHSPAGAVMVFALLTLLAVTTISGIVLLAIEDNAGPLSMWIGEVSRETRRAWHWIEELHEIATHLTLALIFAHVAGVAFASIAHRENLVRAMITGRKRP
jgi:cytochrome b